MKKVVLSGLLLMGVAACGGETNSAAQHNGVAVQEPHIVSTKSNADFNTTLAQLQSAIDARGFKTFAVIDHAAGAASVDQALRPTTLVIFGNPKGGTPVLQADQRMGLELPLKIAVLQESDGGVIIVYRDMSDTFHAHGIAETASDSLEKISGVLADITTEAAR